MTYRPHAVVGRLRDHRYTLLLVVATCLLAAGAVGWLAAQRDAAGALWVAATVVGLGYSIAALVAAARRRVPSVDVIATLALGGTLVVHEPLAGALIAVMLASGRVLEARADVRARRDLSLLVQGAPRIARRRMGDSVIEVPVDELNTGERVVVASGEVVPVDGRLLVGAVLDESALTGESRLVERGGGDEVRSGVVNAAGEPLELVATATAERSTYSGVVRLVAQAQSSSAPAVRLADRLAAFFVPITLGGAGLAWALTGDAIRAVAVLVVATPCPLLLAVPIAIMSGLSRTARAGVIVKGGAALEGLAAGRV